MIIKDKEALDFIKLIYEYNQSMKKIYKEQPNFSPIYLFTNSFMLHHDMECIPQVVKYNFGKKINYENFIVSIDSKEFFQAFKDASNRNSIDKIEISKNEINIYKENKLYYTINNNFSKQIYNNYKINYNNYISDEINNSFDLSKDIIDLIINEQPKKLHELTLDFDEEKIYLSNDYNLNNSNIIKIFLNKKFLIGANYKIKKLKKGDILEYTPIQISIFNTTFDKKSNIYECKLILETKKNDKIEHHFMICDF